MEQYPRKARGRSGSNKLNRPVPNNNLQGQQRNPGSRQLQVPRPTMQQPTSRPLESVGSVPSEQHQGQKNTSEIVNSFTYLLTFHS